VIEPFLADAPARLVHAVSASAATTSMANAATRLLMRFKCLSSPFAKFAVVHREADVHMCARGLKGGGRPVTIR
jgi:hypothetical protein